MISKRIKYNVSNFYALRSIDSKEVLIFNLVELSLP